ncbi:Ectopic P granules protein 5-like [Oopsacas minuta]|uniref:Ectopic P granules protein 5-like n=1 Tax=Oopsacas minuta TaxID=111878 RepID=A0AAV7JAN5_9METZ|nr:Ectopic P granules protein 5-like [Oopsacas minuta]
MATAVRPVKQKKQRAQKREAIAPVIQKQPEEEIISSTRDSPVIIEEDEVKSKIDNTNIILNGTLDPVELYTDDIVRESTPNLDPLPLAEPVLTNLNIEKPAVVSAPPQQAQLLDITPPLLLQKEVKPIYPTVSTLEEDPTRVIPDLLTPEMPARFSHREREESVTHPDSLVGTLRPLTEMELYSFCPTPLLDGNQVYVDSFVRRANPTDLTGHPLYVLLVKFQTSRLEHIASQEEGEMMEKRAANTFSRIWSVSKKEVKSTGRCRDHNRVVRTHEYESAEMNREELQNLEIISIELRNHLLREVSLKASHCEYDRIEIVSYLSNLLQSCEEFRNLTSDKPVRATDPAVLHFITETQNSSLRDCLSVLFIFERRPKSDVVFQQLVRHWVTALLSHLIRTATYSDHLFILNHFLRCPPGVGSWGAAYLQFQPLLELTQQAKSGQTMPYNQGYNLSPLSDHFLTMLATLLLPVKEREVFLKHLEIEANTPGNGRGEAWVFVAEDVVEDDEEAVNKKYLVEEDLVSVFDQFPFTALFQYLLLEGVDQQIYVSGYSVDKVSSHGMMTLVAFCSRLVELLGAGFSTFKLARYRGFVKRLGRTVRYVVHLVSDHWLAYRHYREEIGDTWTETTGPSMPGQSVHSLQRIQVEMDSFVIRATRWILSSHKLGAWQFLADMPFETVSLEAVWKVFWLIHSNHLPITAEELISRGLGRVSGLKDILKDPDYREQFIDNIMRIPLSEAIFLFTTFANMARAREYSRPKDYEFIEIVVFELMEVSFLNPVSRDTYSRTGRDLLDTIVLKHPQVISILVQITSEALFMMGDNSLFLFNSFSFSDWLPAPRDIQVLTNWLIRTDLGTNENNLSQLVLGRMNWGHKDDGTLFLPGSLHREVAIAIVEACGRQIPKIPGNIGQEGAGQAKGFREVIQSYLPMLSEDQQKVLSWSWKVTLLLSLHSSEVNPPDNEDDYNSPAETEEAWTPHVFPLDLHHDVSLVSLSQAVKTNGPLACYVALCVSMIGHETDLFCHEGIELLQVLMDNKQYIPAMRILKNVSPRFFEMKPDTAPPNLLKIIYQLSQADVSTASLTEKWILGEGSKFNKCFCSLLHQQISERWEREKSAGLKALKFWTATMITYPDWYRDKKLLSIVNALCLLAFNKPEMEKVMVDNLYLCVQSLPRHPKKGSRMQSVVSMVIGDQDPPSLLDYFVPQEHGWYAYFAMQAEEKLEKETGVWKALLTVLRPDPRQSFEAAMKSCTSELKLQNYPLSYLCIYRWGKLSNELPHTHPLLPLCWQRFMFYYLQRPAPSGTAAQPSLGYIFFENYPYFTQLKVMRKNLQACHQHFKELSISQQTDTTCSVVEKDLTRTLKQMFLTLELWIEEPRIHEADLYLPALPPQYDTQRLSQLVSNQLTLWLELVNLEAIQDSINKSCKDWISSFEVKKPNSPRNLPVKSVEKRILNRISLTDTPSPIPPLVPVDVPFVPVLRSCLSDPQLLLTEIKKDLRCITNFFDSSQLKARDLNQMHSTLVSLVPDLHQNVPQTTTLYATCKTACTGACQLQFRYNQARKNDSIAQLIDTNILNTKTLITEAKTDVPVEFSNACLRISATIHDLKEVSDNITDGDERNKLEESARVMFYELLSSLTQRSNEFPTSREFYYNCCQDLGIKFIASQPGEAVKLIELIQERIFLTSFVVSLFRPDQATTLEFIDMYSKINRLISQHDSTIGATLMSKFDVNAWLKKQYKDSLEMFRLIELIFEGFGMKEVKQDDTLLLIYLSHLENILKHDFPAVFSAVLHQLLGSSESGDLSSHPWKCFLDRLNAVEQERGRIQEDFLLAELTFISKQMMEQRIASQQTLYTLWDGYQQYLGAVITSLIEMVITNRAEKCAIDDDGFASSTDLKEVWDILCDAYLPWLFPAQNADGSFNIPWHLSECESSSILILKFVNCIVHMQQKLPTRKGQPNVLNLFWNVYTSQLAAPTTPESILERLQSGFLSLHWDLFLPSLTDLESMLELRSSKHTLVFIAGVFVKIKWDNILTSSSYPALRDQSPLSFYLSLSITLLTDEYVLKQTEHGVSIYSLSEHGAEHYNWEDVSVKSFEPIYQWLRDNKSPEVFLLASSSHINKFLQAASGYPSYSHNKNTQNKQALYISFLVDSLSKYSLLPESTDLPAKRAVTTLISLITSVCVSSMSLENRANNQDNVMDNSSTHITLLISELLNILNNSAPSSLVLRTTFINIINSLSPSPGDSTVSSQVLCLPALSAACRSLAAMSHMVEVIETCIETHFTGLPPPTQEEITGTDGVMLLPKENGYGWKQICDSLTIPEMSEDEYISNSLELGCCLTLFSKILLDLPNCKSLEEELIRAKTIAKWCASIKPSPVVESKLILLIVQFFKLITRQVRFGTPPVELLSVISSFATTLAKYTEDKSSEGLLGAIGLGRKSDLSVKFRLACRILQSFVTLQLPVDCNSVIHLRIVPRAPGHPKDPNAPSRDVPGALFASKEAEQFLLNLTSLANNKAYSPLYTSALPAISMVNDIGYCFVDCPLVFMKVVSVFYPDSRYLDLARVFS